MARKPRVHFEGAIYHVIVRGNNREVVFREDTDKERYMKLLAYYKDKYAFRIYAYVLMDNHVHMLVEVAHHPLAKVMQGIQQSYTQYFNKKYDRVGHVFQQRYKALLCTKDEYLISLIKYIHFNPLKAGLSHDLTYQWSSHREYLRPKQGIVDAGYILGIFSDRLGQALELYRQAMSNTDSDTIDPSKLYITNSQDTPEGKSDVSVVYNLRDILSRVSVITNLPEENLDEFSRNKDILNARKIFIYIASKYGNTTGVELADILKISPSQVSRNLKAAIQDNEIRHVAERIAKDIFKNMQ